MCQVRLEHSTCLVTVLIQLLFNCCQRLAMDAETRNMYLKCRTTTKGSFEDFRALRKKIVEWNNFSVASKTPKLQIY